MELGTAFKTGLPLLAMSFTVITIISGGTCGCGDAYYDETSEEKSERLAKERLHEQELREKIRQDGTKPNSLVDALLD